ncbi:MAG: ATP-binding protein [Victivallaceae bacterium]
MNLLDFSFPAELHFLKDILSQIKRLAYPYMPVPKQLFYLELACEEAIMNIISYAYSTGPGTIDISCAVSDETFDVKIQDEGTSFNPLENSPSTTANSLKDNSMGGVGLILLFHAADKTSYRREQNKNILTLSFYIQKSESSS